MIVSENRRLSPITSRAGIFGTQPCWESMISGAFAQRLHLQFARELVELCNQLARQRYAVAQALIAALAAAIAGQADFVDARQALRRAQIADMAIDLGAERSERQE